MKFSQLLALSFGICTVHGVAIGETIQIPDAHDVTHVYADHPPIEFGKDAAASPDTITSGPQDQIDDLIQEKIAVVVEKLTPDFFHVLHGLHEVTGGRLDSLFEQYGYSDTVSPEKRSSSSVHRDDFLSVLKSVLKVSLTGVGSLAMVLSFVDPPLAAVGTAAFAIKEALG
ncbi:hypothetical protein JCM33374_g5174 [Metschnikowia sp. JCM 33374]|nr:hypothetical protein JCM33374_g5174 [Metschnikowia sp. JCM 33374]